MSRRMIRAVVDHRQPLHELPEDVAQERLVRARSRRRRMANVFDDRLAAYQLHREEPSIALAEQLVERDEIRMGKIGQRPEFAFEPIEGRGVGCVQQLQGDRRTTFAIENFVDDTEAALPEAAANSESGSSRGIRGGTLIRSWCR